MRHLPLAQVSGVDTLTITTDDREAAKELPPSVLAEPSVASKLQAVQGSAGHRTVSGVGDFVSSLVVGALWTAFGTSVAFGYSATLFMAGALLVLRVRPV